ncbi:MAG TPA: ROK family protein [Candidatus Lumbricidophila sp.]|nr:ROK family protein [Candidatus Lumbricidophila sp.]
MNALCIDFGGTVIKFGIFNGAEALVTESLPNTGDRADLERVAGIVHGWGLPFGSAGIAVPGIVDRANSALLKAHGKYEWATGVNLDEWTRSAFGVPAAVENDGRAACLGEARLGAAAGSDDVVMVTLGTGIGSSAVIQGKLLVGGTGHAGVLGGHFTVDLNGPACNCGNIGCAEAVASSWALERDCTEDPRLAAALGHTADSPARILDLFTNRDHDDARPTFDRFISAWVAAIVNLCHAYDPAVVIVAGGVLGSKDLLLPLLRDRVHARLWSSSPRPEFRTPDRPEHSVLLGLSAAASDLRAAAAPLSEGMNS